MGKESVQKPVNKTITAGMGRIPKLVKKHPDPPDKDNKKLKETLSFGDLLGSMDTSKPRNIVKNKSKDLLESLMSSSPNKPKKEEKKKTSLNFLEGLDKERDRDRDREKERKKEKEKEGEGERKGEGKG